MQVFNTFFKVLRSKLPIALIYIGVFVAMSIVMSFSDTARAGMFEQERLKVCIFDEDNTPASAALCDFIGKRNDLATLENDRDIIIDALYYGRVDYVLTIKNGYSEKLLSGDTDGLYESMRMHDTYSTVYMAQMLNEYASTVSAYIAGGNDVISAADKAAEALLKDAEVTTAVFDDNSGAAFSQITAFYFRFLAYILIGAIMNTLCPVLLAMNRKDIRFRTNCSGIHPNSYTMQIFAGSTVYILATWLIFMIVGVFMNGGMFEGRQWIAVLNSFVFTLFSAMLTLFVSSFDPSINIINIITQVVSLGMCFTSGVFIEQSMLGEGVLAAARFFPAYWYIRVNNMLSGTEPFDQNTVILSIAIEAGFAVVMAVLTILIRRVRYGGIKTARSNTAAAA